MSIGAQLAWEGWRTEARDDHGRWTRGAAALIEKITEPIGDEGARGNSRAVSHDEFQAMAAEGRDRLHAIQSAPWNTDGMRQNWPAVKDRTFAEVQKPWGGATIDPRTGQDLPQGADRYAMSIKPSGLDTTSIPENASRHDFGEAMDVALAKYGNQLAKGGSYLGVFHDDDLNRIDIDPVTVLDTPREVETVGAYTHAIGGAYHFASGNGHWPPHVPGGAQMSGDDHHWEGPGQWHSHAAAVQQPHDEPEDAASPETISEQATAGDGIAGQVDLAKWEGWRTETRGRGGQWQRGPASLGAQVRGLTGAPRSTHAQRSARGKSIQTQIGEGLGYSRMAGRSRAAQESRAHAAAAEIAQRTAAEQQAEQERMHQNQIHQAVAVNQAKNMIQTGHLHKQQQEDLQGQIRTLERAVRRSNQTILELQKQEKETEQKAEAAAEAVQGQKDANKKALIEGTVAIAGALVAFLTAGLGLPLVATLAIGLLGPEYQVFQEWRDHL